MLISARSTPTLEVLFCFIILPFYRPLCLLFFFFNDTAPPEISPLPLPDALPICSPRAKAPAAACRALDLAPQLAEAPAAAGPVGFVMDWDWATAARELRQAIAKPTVP